VVFKIGTDAIPAGDANGQMIRGILALHIAFSVEIIKAAALNKPLTALDILSGVS
jgi:hypothetical protein